MNLRDPDIWISHLLENLPEDKLACALKDDNPDWEYIDGEMLKLGSLAHSQLDIPKFSAGGWCFWPRKARIFACWPICCVRYNMPVIRCWRCIYWRCTWSITGRWRHRV